MLSQRPRPYLQHNLVAEDIISQNRKPLFGFFTFKMLEKQSSMQGIVEVIRETILEQAINAATKLCIGVSGNWI